MLNQYVSQSLCPISYKDRIFQQVQGDLGVLRLVIDFTNNEHIICDAYEEHQVRQTVPATVQES